MAPVTTRRVLWGGGLYEYLGRLVVLQVVQHFILPFHTSMILRGVFAFIVSIVLCVLHLSLEVRNMRGEGKSMYEATKAKLAGAEPQALEAKIREEEDAFEGLRASSRKGVVWADDVKKSRTPLCFVYLHGWSACRLESAPLVEELAAAHGANCYFSRLPGHGRIILENKVEELSLRSLVAEAVEALARAEVLGERVVLVGSSTGGALAAWLTLQPWAVKALDRCVLISTNVWTQPAWLIRIVRCVPVLRELVLFAVRGTTSKIVPSSDAHGSAWTLFYPSRFLAAVFDVSAMLALEDPKQSSVPTLAFHCPKDPVASCDAAKAFVQGLPQGRFKLVDDSEHPHVITGNILSPSTVPKLKEEILGWMKGQ